MPWGFWFLPLIGAIIGWLTNILAIRMIFRPRFPVRIPLLPITIQGLLPKRRDDLARSVAEVVERDLLPADQLVQRFDPDGFKREVVHTVVAHVDKRLQTNMPRFLPVHIRSVMTGLLRDVVARETGDVMDHVANQFQQRLTAEMQLGPLVEEKMRELNLDELERLVNRLAARELRHIEVLGALLGLTIGLVQMLVVWGIAWRPFA